MILDLKTIKSVSPCADQFALIKKTWPKGVPLTAATVKKIVALSIDFEWFAHGFLTATARAEYERVKAPAWAEYERVKAPARAEYERVTATARAEYERVMAMVVIDLIKAQIKTTGMAAKGRKS